MKQSALDVFKDTKLQCFANVRLADGAPCFVSIAVSGILVKKSRLGLFGPVLYSEKVVYKNANTAKALAYLYGDKLTPPTMHHPILVAFTNAVLHCATALEVTHVLNTAIEEAERISGQPIDDLPVFPHAVR